jgi:hypothetical protein
MRQMVAALPARLVRFLLVSDEAIDGAHFQGLEIMVGLGDVVGDLYSLAACDYLIGPPSTFSIWAAWYGDIPLYHVENPATPLRLEYFKSAR